MSQDFAFIVLLRKVVLEEHLKDYGQNVWKQWFNMEMVE